eukprot:GHRQ01024041.1.p1 GENE.GHRQ01024041.1~~GHRQ01024041.1.p1  ORF type:complete len:139 (+),score=28.12 GHRQ01024041.1:598-1014(+)
MSAALRCHTKSFAASNPKCRRGAVIVRAEKFTVTKPTLVDAPVSNHGARVRHVIYAKGLEGEVDIVSPVALGGFGSEQFLAANPLNKVRSWQLAAWQRSAAAGGAAAGLMHNLLTRRLPAVCPFAVEKNTKYQLSHQH